jgi:hypothetical protein
MKLQFENRHEANEFRAAFAELCRRALKAAAAYPPLIAMLAGHAKVHVTFADGETSRLWGVPGDALGFFAVMRHDGFEETGEGDVVEYFDVNERVEAVVDVEAAERAFLSEEFDDELDFESSLVSLASTAIHEVLHACDWIKASGGRTPLEVFDEDGGEDAVRAILEREGGKAVEDRIEAAAGRLAALSFNIDSVREASDAIKPWASFRRARALRA